MSIYLVLVHLMLPGQEAPAQVVPAGWMTASTPAVCQAKADRAAEAYRAQYADTVRRLGARVVGVCVHRGEMP